MLWRTGVSSARLHKLMRSAGSGNMHFLQPLPLLLTMPVSRRSFLFLAMANAGVLSVATMRPVSATQVLVPNVSGLYAVAVAKTIQPTEVKEIVSAMQGWDGKVSVGGGRYSMGGQIAIVGGLHIDMRRMNKLVWFRPEERCVRVEAGMRWRDLQEVIDPHGLSVTTMQSYANFTVGGSVSVNAHGRYVGNGALANSVRSLQLVLSDGQVVEANRSLNRALFCCAIGGYGAVGVISEVELDLAENVRMERVVHAVPLGRYPEFFKTEIERDGKAVMHNADLVPPEFDAPIAVTWRVTSKPLTDTRRLIPKGLSYPLEQNVMWALTEIPFADRLQASVVRPILLSDEVVRWRNCEASLDVAQLEPRTRRFSTYALQEYFVPPRRFMSFVTRMAKILKKNEVEALNVSIRHSPADTVSALPWAKEEVFCFVLYYKQRTDERARAEVGRWTRELIDLALENEGRYYLPYQLHATTKQFRRAYPEAEGFARIKASVDPGQMLSNEMLDKYL